MLMSEMPHCSYDVLISFQADTSVVILIVLCLGAEFLCCCVRFHIFSDGKIAAHSPHDMFSEY